MDRIAAVLFAVSGIPTTLVMPFILVWILANDALPIMGGVRGLSGGPFEQFGPRAMALLGVPFVATGVLEVVAARRLWRRDGGGRSLGIWLLAPTELFAIGYDLPIWHGLVALRTAAIALALSARSRGPAAEDL